MILLLPCPGSATLHFYGYPSFRFSHIYLLESKTAASTNVHKDRRIIVIPFRNRSADSKDSLTKGSERTNQIFRNYFNRFSFSFLVVVVKFGIFCVTFNNKNHSQTHGKGKETIRNTYITNPDIRIDLLFSSLLTPTPAPDFSIFRNSTELCCCWLGAIRESDDVT